MLRYLTTLLPDALIIEGMGQTMPEKAYVYLHCKPNGVPFYVGKGRGRRGFRMTGRNKFYRDILSKYGADQIKLLIIICATDIEAFDLERFLIAKLRRKRYRLANFNDGGEGSLNPSPQTKAKMRAAKLGKPMPINIRSKIAATMVGKPKSPEHVAKVAASLKGRIVPLEERLKQSKSRRGKKQSEASILKRSASLLAFHAKRRAEGKPWFGRRATLRLASTGLLF